MSDPLIRVEGLSYGWGAQLLLEDASFDLTMALMASGGSSVHSCKAKATFSPTVSALNSAPD
jgi:hypothetical protein